MKKILTVAIAATAIAATPAAAQDSSRFQGGHVGVNAGFSDTDFVGFEEFNYGIEAGYNHDTGGAVIGISGELNDNNDIKRELAAVLRAGGKVGKLATEILSSKGLYVRATTRSGRQILESDSKFVAYAPCDVTNDDSLKSALVGASGCIFAASASGKKKGGEPIGK